jgi:hypothetical protein
MTEIIIKGDWSTDQLCRLRDSLDCDIDSLNKADAKLVDDFISQAIEQIGFSIDEKKPGGM